MFQKIFSNLTNKTITTSSSSCPATKLMSERRTEGRHRYVKTTQSCSNFPNNNNSLPPSLLCSVFVFVVGYGLAAGRLQRKLEMKRINSNQVKTPTPSQANPIIVRSYSLWGNGDIRGIRNYPREILTNSLVIPAHSPQLG